MLLLASLALFSAGSSSHAKNAATGFAIAKNDPVKLRNFLLRMPKGGDLHNHLTGTIYAESYLGWAAEDGKCWDSSARSIVPGPLLRRRDFFCRRLSGRTLNSTAYY